MQLKQNRIIAIFSIILILGFGLVMSASAQAPNDQTLDNYLLEEVEGEEVINDDEADTSYMEEQTSELENLEETVSNEASESDDEVDPTSNLNTTNNSDTQINTPQSDQGSSVTDLIDPEEADAQVEKLVSPNDAQAGLGGPPLSAVGGTLKTVYDINCSYQKWVKNDECPLDSSSWSLGMLATNMAMNPVTLAVCDKDMEELLDDGMCVDPTTTYGLQTIVQGKDGDGKYQYTRVPGGAALIIAETYAYLLDPQEGPIPTDLALFMKDSVSDTMLGTPSYAQGGLFLKTLEGIVLEAWKVSRNLALALFGAVLAIAALMIMFRTKISPQVSVSIYNVLPMIPVVLGLILLSYPIIAVLFSFIPAMMGIAFKTSIGIVVAALSTSGGDFRDGVTVTTDNGIWVLIVESINSGIQFVADRGIQLFAVSLMIIVSILAVLMSWIFILVAFVRVYVSMIINTIISPFVILSGLIPGRQKVIVNFGKILLADALALPIMLFFIIVGFALLAYVPDTADFNGGSGGLGIIVEPLLTISSVSITLTFVLIKTIFGLNIIWKAGSARKTIRNTLGVTDTWGGGDDRRR